MRYALAIFLLLSLAGCAGGEHKDLRAELKKLTANMRGRVPPLPVVKPYKPVAYNAFDLKDPFSPSRIELEVKTANVSGGLKPDFNRPKEPLEAFPLESLKVVGMIQEGKDRQALVRAEGSIYRVKVGDYMGQNFGLITGITDTEVRLRELIQDPTGDWTERNSTLQLQEAGGNQ